MRGNRCGHPNHNRCARSRRNVYGSGKLVSCIGISIITGTDQAPVALSSTASPKLALVNLGLLSLFKDLALFINNQKVKGDSQLYAYKAYMYNLLAVSTATKAHQLASCGWIDEAKKYDDVTNAG